MSLFVKEAQPPPGCGRHKWRDSHGRQLCRRQTPASREAFPKRNGRRGADAHVWEPRMGRRYELAAGSLSIQDAGRCCPAGGGGAAVGAVPSGRPSLDGALRGGGEASGRAARCGFCGALAAATSPSRERAPSAASPPPSPGLAPVPLRSGQSRQPARSEPRPSARPHLAGLGRPAAPYNLIFPRARRSIAAHLLYSAAPRGGRAGEKGGPGEPSLRPPPPTRRPPPAQVLGFPWAALLSSLPCWHPGPRGRQRGVCRHGDLRDLALKEPERRLFTLHYQPGAQVPAPRGARPRLQVPPPLPTAPRSPHERCRGRGEKLSPAYLWSPRGDGAGPSSLRRAGGRVGCPETAPSGAEGPPLRDRNGAGGADREQAAPHSCVALGFSHRLLIVNKTEEMLFSIS